MTNQLILPLSSLSGYEGYPIADDECATIVTSWLNTRIELIHEVWSHPTFDARNTFASDPADLTDQLIGILTHRLFNHQSKCKLSHLLPAIRHHLFSQVCNGARITFFLLYNGGYRASSLPNKLSLIYDPDHTELMLLYQIALLHSKVSAVYEPGIELSIVINNGVAHWVNDIPLDATVHYANQLRRLIRVLGAEGRVNVLLQSELDGYDPNVSLPTAEPQSLLTAKEHHIVERFLGRPCSLSEAMHRSALYNSAESLWGEELTSIAKAKNALMLRQVAHPDMISFRPFPGGAIRSQNGSLGFQHHDKTLKPKLITSHSVAKHGVVLVQYHFQSKQNGN